MVRIGSLLLVFVLACFVVTDLASAKGRGGKKGNKQAKQSIESLFQQFDKDKDGKLSPAEFVELKQAQAKQQADKAFKKADANKDGYLSLDELKAGAQKKGGKKRAKAD
jgi:Ca2+-binding EF-hand superfamily protein